jgi:hypothetical protein
MLGSCIDCINNHRIKSYSSYPPHPIVNMFQVVVVVSSIVFSFWKMILSTLNLTGITAKFHTITIFVIDDF